MASLTTFNHPSMEEPYSRVGACPAGHESQMGATRIWLVTCTQPSKASSSQLLQNHSGEEGRDEARGEAKAGEGVGPYF